MKCQKKCKKIYQVKFTNGKVCFGINLCPSTHPMDKIRYCVKSDIVNREIELTIKEAAYICSGLSNCIAELSTQIKKKI